jgi:ABC-type antimicrobial peptide transport system permease subunit
VAPDVATYGISSLDDIVRDARARMTTATRLMTLYALAALLLAVAGTNAVLSFLVTQRRRELAVRMALGAGPRVVLRLVARESGVLIGIGVVVGLAGAFLATRLLSGLLYGVGALDARVTLLVVASAALAGVAAAAIPARRATRTDPSTALRTSG